MQVNRLKQLINHGIQAQISMESFQVIRISSNVVYAETLLPKLRT